MSDKEETKTDPVLQILAVFCWGLPLAGYLWGPGEWWQYALWLIIGTAIMLGYQAADERKKEEAP